MDSSNEQSASRPSIAATEGELPAHRDESGGRVLLLAEASYRSGHFEDALRHAEQLSLSPELRGWGLVLKARALMALNQNALACEAVDQIRGEFGLADMPADLAVLLLRNLARSHGVAHALSLIDEIHSRRQQELAILNATLLAASRRPDDGARLLWNQLDDAAPDARPSLALMAARLYGLAGNFVLATVSFEQALKNLPPNGRRYYQAARVAVAAGRYHLAAGWVNQAQSHGLRSAVCWALLGRIRVKLGYLGLAANAFGKAEEADPTNERAVEHANALLAAHRVDQALEVLAVLLARAPDYAPGIVSKVRCLADLGRRAEAVEIASRFGDEHPQEFLIQEVLVELYWTARNFAQARDACILALSQRPDDGALRRRLQDCEAMLAGESMLPAEEWTDTTPEPALKPELLVPEIPPAFAPSWTAADLNAHEGTIVAFKRFFRVVYAVMMREMRSRHSHSRMGYLVEIGEASTMTLVHLTIWSILGSPIPQGMSKGLFLVTGLVSTSMCFAAIGGMRGTLKSDPMLLFPIVRTLDKMFGAAVLQFMTYLVTLFILFIGVVVTGGWSQCHNWLLFFAGFILAWLVGLGLGVFTEGLTPIVDLWPLTGGLMRIMFITSGAFVDVGVMSPYVYQVVTWNPLADAIGFMRVAFDPGIQNAGMSLTFPLLVGLVLLTIGLLLERALRTTRLDQ